MGARMKRNFVYYSEKFNDGGLIEVFFLENDEPKFPTTHGINLFNDDEIKDFLNQYRKTSFICSSTDKELTNEVRRLSRKFKLNAQMPD